MLAPIRLLRGRWPSTLEKRLSRFCWSDPRAVLDPAVSEEEFRAAMSAIHVGDTIKITGKDRHPLSDRLLVDVAPPDVRVVDIGASDGSTSVDLVNKLHGFATYTIADLFFHLSARRGRASTVFYDLDGAPILVVGRRTLAWPSQSKAVAFLYRPVLNRVASATAMPVLLLNPAARQLMESDDRVRYEVHNVFVPWTSKPAPTAFKIANLLRRFYFSDDEISRALHAVHVGLADHGLLLIVDNPRIEGIVERGGLYRKSAAGFERLATTQHQPEIDDLIMAVET